MRFKDDGQQTTFVHAFDEEAELLSLLIDAAEIGFVDEISNRLVGQVGAGSQCRNRGQIKLAGIASLRNQKPALVDDQSSGGVGFLEQLLKHCLELLDVFLDELGQGGHVMRIAAWTG